MTFSLIQDLGAWFDETFEGKPIPFGVFVDPYTVFQRITSFVDTASELAVEEMKVRKDVGMTADEAAAVDSFDHPRLKFFRGAAKDLASFHPWIPGILYKER